MYFHQIVARSAYSFGDLHIRVSWVARPRVISGRIPLQNFGPRHAYESDGGCRKSRLSLKINAPNETKPFFSPGVSGPEEFQSVGQWAGTCRTLTSSKSVRKLQASWCAIKRAFAFSPPPTGSIRWRAAFSPAREKRNGSRRGFLLAGLKRLSPDPLEERPNTKRPGSLPAFCNFNIEASYATGAFDSANVG